MTAVTNRDSCDKMHHINPPAVMAVCAGIQPLHVVHLHRPRRHLGNGSRGLHVRIARLQARVPHTLMAVDRAIRRFNASTLVEMESLYEPLVTSPVYFGFVMVILLNSSLLAFK